MSAFILNRSHTSAAPSMAEEGERTLGNSGAKSSPLQVFGQAKKKINDTYQDVISYIQESQRFLKTVEDESLFGKDKLQVFDDYLLKVNGILKVLSRNRMKVAFFGRTSNGKSTVINAMLRDKILPTGIGHTTNCFIQVEGSSKTEAYLLTPDSTEPKNVLSVAQLGHALSAEKLSENSIVHVHWPKEKCRLLREDVVIVDSPGIDVTPDLDSWIDQHCLDADVFVLVCNAESTLMQAEKNFFFKVSAKLSKPNVFVLNNRWDATANEPEFMDEVRQQHLSRGVTFLADELRVCSKSEAEDRIFFVSAKEALLSRMHQERGTPISAGVLLEGNQARLFEFSRFENEFEECLSKTAVRTRFEQHALEGRSISQHARTLMDGLYDCSLEQKATAMANRRLRGDRLDMFEKQAIATSHETREKIRTFVDSVERQVALALADEIRRLGTLLEDFDRPFHPDPLQLTWYKKELHAWLEERLGRNLANRLDEPLQRTVADTMREMGENVGVLLPPERKEATTQLTLPRKFGLAYRLDCRNLCADFREDIEFRFSLGINNVARWLLGSGRAKLALAGIEPVPRPIPSAPQTPCNTDESRHIRGEGELMTLVVQNMALLTSRSSVLLIIVGGVVWKTVGWRLLALSASFYGALYLYERLMWTRRAQERAFKRQYVSHAASKLKLIVDLTSSNCSHQVHQELTTVFTQLSRYVDMSKEELTVEIRELDAAIERLDTTANDAKILRNKAGWLDNEFQSFIKQYLNVGK